MKRLRLKYFSGNPNIRMVGKPYQYWAHKIGPNNQFAIEIPCTGSNCPWCNVSGFDYHKEARFLIEVQNPRSLERFWLKMSSALFRKIQNIILSGQWPDPTKYDVNITIEHYDRLLVQPHHSDIKLQEKHSNTIDTLCKTLATGSYASYEERSKHLEIARLGDPNFLLERWYDFEEWNNIPLQYDKLIQNC